MIIIIVVIVIIQHVIQFIKRKKNKDVITIRGMCECKIVKLKMVCLFVCIEKGVLRMNKYIYIYILLFFLSLYKGALPEIA